MLTGSIPLGRLAGAALRIHWSAVVVALLLGFGLSDDLGAGGAAIGVVAFFASILVHELAHVIVARHFGIGASSIELWGLGGLTRLDRDPRTPRAEGWIAAAGPLASLLVGAAAYGLAYAIHRADGSDGVILLVGGLGVLNVLLGLFNLLPGAPLDGGHVVRAVRWARHGDRYRAMREAALAGRILGWGLGTLGFALVLSGRPSGVWIAVTGLFITVSARTEITVADVSERLAGVTVGEITWYGVAETGTDMDADSMIWQRSWLGGAGAVAVRGDDGSLDGLVLEDQLWAVPAEQRPWTMLTTLMAPFSRLAQADPDDELASVLPKLNPLRPIVTVWRDGRLLGVVPPKALRAKLQTIA